MKAQQAIAIVKAVVANAPHLLKALGYGVFSVIFLGLTPSAFASATLDLLVNAAARFSAAIGQQLVIVQNDPARANFAEKTLPDEVHDAWLSGEAGKEILVPFPAEKMKASDILIPWN
jgi:hypothetical protein